MTVSSSDKNDENFLDTNFTDLFADDFSDDAARKSSEKIALLDEPPDRGEKTSKIDIPEMAFEEMPIWLKLTVIQMPLVPSKISGKGALLKTFSEMDFKRKVVEALFESDQKHPFRTMQALINSILNRIPNASEAEVKRFISTLRSANWFEERKKGSELTLTVKPEAYAVYQSMRLLETIFENNKGGDSSAVMSLFRQISSLFDEFEHEQDFREENFRNLLSASRTFALRYESEMQNIESLSLLRDLDKEARFLVDKVKDLKNKLDSEEYSQSLRIYGAEVIAFITGVHAEIISKIYVKESNAIAYVTADLLSPEFVLATIKDLTRKDLLAISTNFVQNPKEKLRLASRSSGLLENVLKFLGRSFPEKKSLDFQNGLEGPKEVEYSITDELKAKIRIYKDELESEVLALSDVHQRVKLAELFRDSSEDSFDIMLRMIAYLQMVASGDLVIEYVLKDKDENNLAPVLEVAEIKDERIPLKFISDIIVKLP